MVPGNMSGTLKALPSNPIRTLKTMPGVGIRATRSGAACCSAADMGKFLREQVRPDPQVFNAATRTTMQTHQVTTASSFVRGAWSSSAPGSATADIAHNGDNGVSFAHVAVSLSQKTAYGAMSNVNNRFGNPAVGEMHEVMRVMHDRWSQLFTDPKAKFWECAHPMPAVVFAGRKMIAFGRQHDGTVVMLRSTNGGTSWQAGGSLGGVLTSGLASRQLFQRPKRVRVRKGNR